MVLAGNGGDRPRHGLPLLPGLHLPFDNKLRRPGWIRETDLERVFPGAIIVLHEGGSERDYIVQLLAELIPELKAAGYEFLTLSEIQKLHRR